MRGHIRKRSKNSWTVVVELPRDPETGKRRQKWVTVRGTKKDAERVLAETIAAVESGYHGYAPSRLTVGEYLQKWFEMVGRTARPNTCRTWKKFLPWWIELIGAVPLLKLSPVDVQEALNALPESYSESTRAICFAMLRAAMKQAVKWGLIPRCPTDGVKPPNPGRKEMRVWDESQVASFLNAARRSRYYSLFYVALATGIRLGELLGLKWEDVDFEGLAIYVRRSLCAASSRADAPVWREPKTARSRRRIPVSRDVVEVLRKLRRRQAEERLRAGPSWRDWGLVFCTKRGKPVWPTHIVRTLKAIQLRAGVPRIRFHDLRHTHATLLLRQGVNPKVVAERLGHSSVAMTLDVYSHVLPDTQAQAVAALEYVFRSGERRG